MIQMQSIYLRTCEFEEGRPRCNMLALRQPRYHDHGDTIAIQYGGSHLVNTMETYRKINQWTSHSRDMVESFKRYYNNSFLDAQRQEAYNLFLGNYIFAQGQPMLWDLSTDYYLHHADPRTWSGKKRRSYIDWFTPHFLTQRTMPSVTQPQGALAGKPLDFFDDYWLEYYKPLAVSSFLKIFSFRMNSTLRYIPFKSTQEGKYDLSPFRIRVGHEQDVPDKQIWSSGPTASSDYDEKRNDVSSQVSHGAATFTHPALPSWLQIQGNKQSQIHQNIRKDIHEVLDKEQALTTSRKAKQEFKDKSAVTQWTLDQFVSNSLNPTVTTSEANEYERYISHPLNLPLVVSTETPPNPNAEFLSYINSVSDEAISDINATPEDTADYAEFLEVGDDPLTVTEADTSNKRYKAYRQWLKGKSLFKQQRVDA